MNKLTVLAFVCAPLVAGAETAASDGAAPKWVPAAAVAHAQVAHPAPRLPNDWLKEHGRVEEVQGLYKVCIDQTGHVSAVRPLSGIKGADRDIVVQIAENWVYQPQAQPVCFASLLKYQFSEPAIAMGAPPPMGFRSGGMTTPPGHRR